MSAFKIVDGVLKEYYGNDLEVFVPEGVTEIDSSAFAEYRNTVFHKRVIHLPDSVRKIGGGVFSGCINLESINIPDGVTEFGERAFSTAILSVMWFFRMALRILQKGCFGAVHRLSQSRSLMW